MKRLFLILSVFMCFVFITESYSVACNRCGYRTCRYRRYYYKQPVIVKKEVVVQPPNVVQLNVQQPAQLVQPGTSSFGYQAYQYQNGAATFTSIDENLVANLYARISTQANSGLDTVVQQGLAVKAELAEKFGTTSAIQAATAHMLAATQPQMFAEQEYVLKVRRDSSGKFHVEDQEYYQDPQQKLPSSPPYSGKDPIQGNPIQDPPAPPVPPDPVNPLPPDLDPGRRPNLIRQYCGTVSCHGIESSSPGADLYISAQTINEDIANQSTRAILSGKMPKNNPISKELQYEIIKEIWEAAKINSGI